MKWMLAVVAVALLGVSPALAAPANPSTRPAVAPRLDEDPRPRVLVMPFEELADDPSRPWVGKAMQQSLVAELTRSGLVSVLTPAADAPPAKDAAAAAKLARDVQAPLVIIGSYQLIDQELRVTGQMLESINGEPIAGIKATGSLRDLFGIQDIIGGQVRRDLQVILQPTPVAGTSPTNPSRAPNDPFQVEQSGPVQRPVPTGAYNGSELQRSLADEWTPPPAPQAQDGRNRNRYGYPSPPYYPDYTYYDWCGYYWPLIPRSGFTVVPPGPGPTRTDFPQNNYITQPGQMGRPSGGNHIQSHPGQMGRVSGGNSMQGHPGQMGRQSGGNFNNHPGQMNGSSSGSSNQVGPSGQVGRVSSSATSTAGMNSAGTATRVQKERTR